MISVDADMFPKQPTDKERKTEAAAIFEEKYKTPFADLTSHADKYGGFLDTRDWYYYTKDDDTYIYSPDKKEWKYVPSHTKAFFDTLFSKMG